MPLLTILVENHFCVLVLRKQQSQATTSPVSWSICINRLFMFLPCNHQWLHCNHQWLQLQSLIYDYIGFFFVSLLYLYFVLFDAKSTLSDAFFGVFWIRYGAIFGACRFPRVTRRGHHREVRFVKMLRYPLVSCRYLCIFCKRMHLQYIEAFLVSTLGLCPKPQPHLRRRRGRRLNPTT